jgi:pimeloyl-ACP methyl ester carboxylesterase
MREGLARGLFYNKELATEAFALDRWRLTTAYKSGDTVEAIRQSVLTEKQQYVDGRLNEIKVPTLVIWGRDDNLVPLSEGEDYHAKIVGSKFVVVPECGHAPPIEKPGVFLKSVFEFLGAAAQ